MVQKTKNDLFWIFQTIWGFRGSNLGQTRGGFISGTPWDNDNIVLKPVLYYPSDKYHPKNLGKMVQKTKNDLLWIFQTIWGFRGGNFGQTRGGFISGTPKMENVLD